MKNSGLKNEAQVAKIFVSGSVALPQTNDTGVRLFKESDLTDGIISGKLTRPKYNTSELKKSVDTTIFELLPNDVTIGPAMVLRTIYQEALDRITELNALLERLNVTIGERDATIAELQGIIEQLRIELENEQLKANIASQQSTISNQQIGETTIDLQNAIQNSINEAIARVSLTARVEALLQENESLREQLFGLAAQTAEGAISGGDNGFTVKVNNPDGDAAQLSADLWAKTSHNAGNGRKMTNTIEVSNVTTNNKITNIAFVFDGSPKWFKIKSGASSIEPESSETYDCEYDQSVIGGSGTPAGKRGGISPRRRRIGWKGKAQNYTGVSLKVDVTFADGTTDTVSLSTNFRKNRKG
jgi:flagellin-specific chaperone FliS